MINKLRLAIRNDLEASAETRQFGSGWISGFLALVTQLLDYCYYSANAFRNGFQ